MRCEHIGLKRPRQRPAHIAGRIAHIASKRKVADLLVKDEGTQNYRHDGRELPGQQQTSPPKLRNRQTAAVPGEHVLHKREQIQHGRQHIRGHRLAEAVRDATDSLGRRPANNCLLVFETNQQLVDNVLDFLGHHFFVLVFCTCLYGRATCIGLSTADLFHQHSRASLVAPLGDFGLEERDTDPLDYFYVKLADERQTARVQEIQLDQVLQSGQSVLQKVLSFAVLVDARYAFQDSQ